MDQEIELYSRADSSRGDQQKAQREAGRESLGCQHRKRDNIGQKNYSREVSGKISNLRPNSRTYNFVEVSGHNLESSQT